MMIKKVFSCIIAIVILNVIFINTADEEKGKVLKVPFVKQEGRYECGVAALMSLLKWNDISFTYEEVKRGIYSESAKGTFPVSIELFLRNKKLPYQTLEGNLDMLKRLIEHDIPSIALLKSKAGFLSINHYYVVIGFEKDKIVVHDGSKAFRTMDSKKFMKKWSESSYWLLHLGGNGEWMKRSDLCRPEGISEFGPGL